MARKLIQRGGEREGQVGQRQPTQDQGRLLGGALPIVGGILGGLGGGVAGSVIPGPGTVIGATGGAGIGAASGTALENLIEELLGRQQETPLQQLGTAGKETAFAAGGELAGLGAARLGGKLLGPVARPLSKALKERVAPGLVRASIQEPRRVLERTLKRIAGEEVEKGAGEVIERGTKQLSEQIVERGETGTANQLLQRAQSQLKDVPGSLTNRLNKLSKNLPGKPDLDKIMMEAIERADEGLPGGSQTDQLLDIGNDILKKQRNKISDWGDLLEFRKNLDKIGGGKIAEETPAAITSLRRALADRIRQEFPEQMQKMISEQQYYILLRDAAAGKAASRPFTYGDVFTVLVGGAPGVIAGSPIGAAAGVGALKAPFSPIFGTNAAQLLANLVPTAGKAATTGSRALGQVAPRVLLRNLLNQQGNTPQGNNRRQIQ